MYIVYNSIVYSRNIHVGSRICSQSLRSAALAASINSASIQPATRAAPLTLNASTDTLRRSTATLD